ncbi:X-ray repair cross-complementing protein 5-like [Vespa mandarinia]|uniref:X-ray repair cross-complementing protein 5-like n=1 Tax=Vespa mandarinia TaxID=7446 RepID=UPI00160D8220|nr:X-ray repair cross-complementing protein 5-like [Vespa mandarinia]
MANKKESLIFVIDVGVSSKDSLSNSFLLDKAKVITRRLIERKIFYRPKDEIGLILSGSTISFNRLDFKNIQEVHSMQVPNWNLIKIVSNLELTDCISNWIKALYVAIDYVKRECVDKTNKKIVLFSDFKEVSKITDFDISDIIPALKDQEITLLAIGLEPLFNKPQNTITSSENLILDIYKQANGKYKRVNQALDDVKFIRKTQSRLLPWTCLLELLDVKIPIKSFVKVTKESRFPSWENMTNETSQSKTIEPNKPVKVERVKEYQDRQREFHNSKHIIHGYIYGGVFIPFSKEDEEAMLYKSGPKSYKFLYFTKKNHVDIQYWCSSTSNHIILPADKNAAPQFYNLMQAMINKDVVAIVRKVYRNNSNPNIVALFPRINIPDEPWCFVEIILPFAEDIRRIEFKPLKSFVKKLSKKQNKIVDDLLDAFMLIDTNNSSIKKFMPGCVPNPMKQNAFNMLSYRALNPEKPLPPVDIEVTNLLTSDQEITESNIENIKILFDLPNDTMDNIQTSKDTVDMQSKEKPNVESSQTLDAAKNNSVTNNDTSEEMILPSDILDVDMDSLVNNI